MSRARSRTLPDPCIPFFAELLSSTDPLVQQYVQDGIFLIVGVSKVHVIDGDPKNYAGIILGKDSRLEIRCKVGTETNPVPYIYFSEYSTIVIHESGVLNYSNIQGIRREGIKPSASKAELYGVYTSRHPERFKSCDDHYRISDWWKDNVCFFKDVEVSDPATSAEELLHEYHATHAMALLEFAGVNIEANYASIIDTPFDLSFVDSLKFEPVIMGIV